MRSHGFLILLSLLTGASRLAAQDSLLVEVHGVTYVLRSADLRRLPADTVEMQFHSGPRLRFAGPTVLSVLNAAGADLAEFRGRALAQYVLVESSDRYQVVFAVAELSSEFRAGRIILAWSADGDPLAGDGPFRVIAEGEPRAARSARNVVALRLRSP
jgi:hypothetical protein